MAKYNLEAKYFLSEHLRKLDDEMIDKLWTLYCRIAQFWEKTNDPSLMKSDFLVFISNRIEIDIRYLVEYVNCIEVIEELIEEQDEDSAFSRLFTDPLANITPAISKIARAKQLVVNEFIGLYLALGGFRTFGDPAVPGATPLNYPGFIGGMNLPDQTPYRALKHNYEA